MNSSKGLFIIKEFGLLSASDSFAAHLAYYSGTSKVYWNMYFLYSKVVCINHKIRSSYSF